MLQEELESCPPESKCLVTRPPVGPPSAGESFTSAACTGQWEETLTVQFSTAENGCSDISHLSDIIYGT